MLINNQRKQTLISMFFVLFSSFCFSGGISLVKLITPSVPSLMILFFRCLFAFIFLLPFAFRHGIRNFKTTRVPLHLTRVIFISVALFSTYYAYRNLPMASSSAIGFTGPLFTTLFAFFFLREKLTYKKWLLIALGYVGVLTMFQSFSFSFGIPIAVALLANILASGSSITGKKLLTTESSITLLLYGTGATLLLSSVAVIGTWQLPPLRDIYLLIGVALCGLLSNFATVEALKYGKASFVAPFEYTRLIFASMIGYLFFEEIPHINVVAGAIVIAASTFLLTRLELSEKKVVLNM